MPKPEREVVGKQESVRGLRGMVERTSVKGGIYYPSFSNVLDALALFASGEFRTDPTDQSKFFPGVLPLRSALGSGTSRLGFLIENVSNDLTLGKPFNTEYESTRANFPRRSIININRVPKKRHSGYIVEIANSDPELPDSPATLRTVEEGIAEKSGSRKLSLEEKLILPLIVEEGKFGVDVRSVVNTVRHAIESEQMSSFFSNPNDPVDSLWHNLIRALYTARRLARAEKT